MLTKFVPSNRRLHHDIWLPLISMAVHVRDLLHRQMLDH